MNIQRGLVSAVGIATIALVITATIPSVTIAQTQGVIERPLTGILYPLRFILPVVIVDTYDLRYDIAQHDLSDSATSTQSLNWIYHRALYLTNGRKTDALFVALFATMEHKTIPLEVFGLEIPVPITTETQAAFDTRFHHLPTHMYHTSDADIDKLQHFFGSAWIKRAFGMTWLANCAAELVEIGEGEFGIAGAYDVRDIRADDDGIYFASRADAEHFQPSDALHPNPN